MGKDALEFVSETIADATQTLAEAGQSLAGASQSVTQSLAAQGAMAIKSGDQVCRLFACRTSAAHPARSAPTHITHARTHSIA